MTRSIAAPSSDGPCRAASDFVDRLIANDETAFEEIVRTYGPRMLAVAERYLARRSDAEDAVEEAFVKVVVSGRWPRDADSVRACLHRTVVDCALTRLRSRPRKLGATLAPSLTDGGAHSPWRRWPPPPAHEVLADARTRRVVRVEIDHLPGPLRSVLLLRDVDGLSWEETAEVLDVDVPTAKIRLHRARLALQHALGPRLSRSDG